MPTLTTYRTLQEALRELAMLPGEFMATEEQRERIKVVIKTVLGYSSAHEDLVFATSTLMGFPPVHYGNLGLIAKKLIDSAIAMGPEETAKTLSPWQNAMRLGYQVRTLISGISLEEEVGFSNVRLIPIPKYHDDLQKLLPELTLPTPLSPSSVGDVLMVSNERITPAYATFEQMAEARSQSKNIFKVSSNGQPDKKKTFLEALALAVDHSVEQLKTWYSVDSMEPFSSSTYIGFASPIPQLSSHWMFQCSRSHIEEAIRLQELRAKAGQNLRRLDVPIEHWIRSKRNISMLESGINLGIAMEALFVSDNAPEISYRLRLNVAWFLGRNFEDRQKLMTDTRDVYNIRSDAVHTGKVRENRKTLDILLKGQAIVRQGILKIIAEGRMPDWQNVVLGGHSS